MEAFELMFHQEGRQIDLHVVDLHLLCGGMPSDSSSIFSTDISQKWKAKYPKKTRSGTK